MNRLAVITAIAIVAFGVTLIDHWWHKRVLEGNLSGIRLVVFGPSSWDTFAPGASEETVNQVTRALDAGFRKEHPEVGQIVHDSRGPVSDGLARLRNAQVAGDSLDVVLCAANPVNTAYARLKLIKPMDDLVATTAVRYSPGAVDNFTVDEHQWALPLSAVTVTTFFYNKDLFQKAGVEPPKTYEEFRRSTARFQAIGVIPVVHQGKNAWMWPLYYMSALAQTTGNRQIAYVEDMLTGRQRFDSPMNLKALALTKQWVDDGLLDRQSNELDEDGMKSVFYAGKAAAYFGGSWDVPGLTSNARFQWGVFQFPKYDSEPGNPQSFGGAEAGLCISANTKHYELARAYAEFATRDSNVQALLSPLKPFATSHAGVLGGGDPISVGLRAHLPAAKFLDWIFPAELTDTLQRETQAMMGLSKTPQEVALALQARYEKLVANGYVYKRIGAVQ